MAGAHGAESIRGMIDRAIAEVAEREYQRLIRGLSEEEVVDHVRRALTELEKLSSRKGGTPAYDCEWVALFYVTWYQARHINLVYSFLDQGSVEFPSRCLRVVDLGCGAMAMQFALAVFAATSHQPGAWISVTGIDNSRPMIAIGGKLWKCLKKMVSEEARRCTTPGTIHGLDEVTTDMSEECRTFNSLDEYRRWFICSETDRRVGEDRSNFPTYLIRQRARRPARDAWVRSTHWVTSIHSAYHLRQEMRTISQRWKPVSILLTADYSKDRDLTNVVKDMRYDFRSVEVNLRAGVLQCTTKWRQKLLERLRTSPNDIIEGFLKTEVTWSPRRPIVRAWGKFH